MQKKLVVLFLMVLLVFAGLSAQLYLITRDNGEEYKQKVLSQQRYDSTTIPFKRGNIEDSNGTILAVSNKVYNVILDTKILMKKEENLEPTLEALRKCFGIDTAVVRQYIAEHPNSSYYVMAKRMEYEKMSAFQEMTKDPETGASLRGVWFEDEYRREYPNGSLASDVVGFTTNDNVGTYGLEEFYNDELCGINGREYGYLNEDSNLERTTIPARDGNNLHLAIDSNIQSIVEKYLKVYNEEFKDNFRPGNGAENVGCIIMEVNTGRIIAMADYPGFNLNDPRNTANLIGMPVVDNDGVRTGESVTQEILDGLDDAAMYQQLNALWKNFCISYTYEPGSVSKPFTVAAALEDGAIKGTESYNCEGFLHVGDHNISCHQTFGDGTLTVQQGIERSCNVVLMNVAFKLGKDRFVDYQRLFGMGLKTNVDLAGEARTASMVYTKDNIGPTDLATNSFGQSFNATMIQMITGFCSLINGGYYYEPHIVDKITTADGATIENIEPRVLKRTISQATSDKVREYCNTVVSGEKGTGKTARPAGYMIGGKTGTAETLPRGNDEYVVSFMGYAPVDDPQIAIYVVVDRPNIQYQDNARQATGIVRNVLTEVLPYLNIYMTEELSDKEREELEALQIQIRMADDVEDEPETDEEGNPVDPANPEGSGGDGGEGTGEDTPEEEQKVNDTWKSFPVDPESGYLKDPATGYLYDSETGTRVDGGSLLGGEEEQEEGEEGTEEGEEGGDGDDKEEGGA
ncbi:MAG: cell division protein FtsI [Lachnospiraceae bacterium]|jgi:stage V sporulation protein D (sporulation-specific penicillin-binding protein)|nr:cell division protein FtsI [Lachnospiraceae bacterium]